MASYNNVGAMGLVANRYKYTEDLLALEGASPAPPIEGPPLSGFLPIQVWEPFLASYPDQIFASYLRRGITWGFRIGFNPSSRLKPSAGNFRSMVSNGASADNYIATEVAVGKLRPVPPGYSTHISPLGLTHQPGKFRTYQHHLGTVLMTGSTRTGAHCKTPQCTRQPSWLERVAQKLSWPS